MSHNELLIYAYSTAREAIRQQMLTIGYRRVVDLKPGDEIPSVKSLAHLRGGEGQGFQDLQADPHGDDRQRRQRGVTGRTDFEEGPRWVWNF